IRHHDAGSGADGLLSARIATVGGAGEDHLLDARAVGGGIAADDAHDLGLVFARRIAARHKTDGFARTAMGPVAITRDRQSGLNRHGPRPFLLLWSFSTLMDRVFVPSRLPSAV